MAHRTTAAACPAASVSALRPLEATLHSAASGFLFQLESYRMASRTSPSVTPQLSHSQILILTKSYKAPHNLPPRPLCLIPSHSPPLTHSASATLVLAACSNTTGAFWVASAQRLLIPECFPHPLQPLESPSLSFLTTFIMTWHKFFPIFIVCQPLR